MHLLASGNADRHSLNSCKTPAGWADEKRSFAVGAHGRLRRQDSRGRSLPCRPGSSGPSACCCRTHSPWWPKWSRVLALSPPCAQERLLRCVDRVEPRGNRTADALLPQRRTCRVRGALRRRAARSRRNAGGARRTTSPAGAGAPSPPRRLPRSGERETTTMMTSAARDEDHPAMATAALAVP